jgi:hypothetical protein
MRIEAAKASPSHPPPPPDDTRFRGMKHPERTHLLMRILSNPSLLETMNYLKIQGFAAGCIARSLLRRPFQPGFNPDSFHPNSQIGLL